jgi:rhodanese-related sulfurtransferase
MKVSVGSLVVALGLSVGGLVVPSAALAQDAAAEALEAYFDFVDYQGGNIALQQIPDDQWARYFIVDTRDAKQFAAGHMPKAHNIEWRRVVAQRDNIPQDRPVLVYCNTGTLSSQAGLALRVLGWENVQILHGGFDEYKAAGKPVVR